MVFDDSFDSLVHQQYPTVGELAGKAIWMREPFFLKSTWSDECLVRESVQESIANGSKLIDDGNTCSISGSPPGCRIFRLDQFRANWTFEFGAPPNPLVVDSQAPIESSMFDKCDSLPDPLTGLPIAMVVRQQGTFRFPYLQFNKLLIAPKA